MGNFRVIKKSYKTYSYCKNKGEEQQAEHAFLLVSYYKRMVLYAVAHHLKLALMHTLCNETFENQHAVIELKDSMRKWTPIWSLQQPSILFEQRMCIYSFGTCGH